MGGGSEADFMIHGIMKYHLFGQELWITTTTVGMTIITIVLLILAFAANRAKMCIRDSRGRDSDGHGQREGYQSADAVKEKRHIKRAPA